MKFGLLTYNYTINLGNEIQSIAARRFLPRVDYFIEHHKIQDFNEDVDVKTIMNAWYLNCPEAWPPSTNIDPLLVSMHFSSHDFTQKAVLSKESKEYFKDYGPVGCRDIYTRDFLNDNGIDAYYTGCLTLTLESGGKLNPKDEDNEYVLINSDYSKQLLSYLKDKTDKKIYVLNQDYAPSFKKAFPGQIPKSLYNHTSYYDYREKLFLAENMLRLYENASCVITDRLHCAMPTLALKTPVLLFDTRQKQERFDGLRNLLNVSNMKEYEGDFRIFDVNDPPKNPDDYLDIRKDLINQCKKFTGHINDTCYEIQNTSQQVNNAVELFSKQAKDSRDYIVEMLIEAKRYENKIKKQQKIIDEQNEIIEEMKNSKSWKITSPLRKLRN